MKKLVSILLALVLVISLATVAMAEETRYTPMEKVTITKNYQVAGVAGAKSPAETFVLTQTAKSFKADSNPDLTQDDVKDLVKVTGKDYVAEFTYAEGDAGSASKTQTYDIQLPVYDKLGIYEYTLTETNSNTAGVSYRTGTIKLVVTVIMQDNGKIRVAAVHTESEGDKSGEFDNTYTAGSLKVSKEVQGLFGDTDKDFSFTVKFTQPDGKTAKSTIDCGNNETISFVNGVATKTFTLKSGDDITFTNIPKDCTYEVTETSYASEGYKTYVGTVDETEEREATGTIGSTEATAAFINVKGGTVDTGITLDSLPFILILAVCAAAAVVFVIKRRSVEF